MAMVHSTLLIHLSAPSAASLAYAPPPPGYAGPVDDIIIFAHSARHAGIAMHIVNRDLYGFMLLPVTHIDGRDTDVDDHEQFVHMKIENISECRLIPLRYFIDIRRSGNIAILFLLDFPTFLPSLDFPSFFNFYLFQLFLCSNFCIKQLQIFLCISKLSKFGLSFQVVH